MPVKTSKLPPRLIIVLSAVLALVLVVHLAGIALLRYFVERELHPALPRGTLIGEVHLNLFSGLVEIEDFQLRNDGELRLRFANLLLDISPARLLTGRVHVEQARLSNGYLRVDRRPDGSFDLGLPPPEPEKAPAEAGAVPALSLAGAELDRVTVEYHDDAFASVLFVEKAKVGAYSTTLTKQRVPVDWALRWDGRAINGNATLDLDESGVAVQGGLQTEPLDLGRAQQLARLTPQVVGEAAFQGEIDWRAPRLALNGDLQAAALGYGFGDRRVHLRGLVFPEFTLQLVTAPTLGLEAKPGARARIAAFDSTLAGQTVTASDLAVAGIVRYAGAGALGLDSLDYRVARLAWQDGERQMSASGVALRGEATQRLDGSDPLPSLQIGLTAEAVEYRDHAGATALQLDGLELEDFSLAPTGAAGTRRVAGRLALGTGKMVQAENTLVWSSLSAAIGGSLAPDDRTTLSTVIALGDLEIAAPPLAAGPLTIRAVSAADLEVEAAGSVRFRSLRLEGLTLPAEVESTALEVAAIDLAGGSYDADAGAQVGEIVIDGLQTGVIRDKAGVWRHVMSDAGTANETPGEAAAEGGGAPAWTLAGLRVTGDSWITVADRLNPDMQPQRYVVERLAIGALSSRAPNRDTPFDLAMRPDQYSEFAVKGSIRPLASPLTLDAEGHLHGFGLPSVNGLVANDLGHRFLEGQLDDDFRIRIDAGRLDMGNTLNIAGLSVEEIEGKDGPPLGAAIALLEDRDGNIKLEVPVAGDLNDPDFRVLGALNPIIMKAVAGTAALAIQPLGSVLLVGGVLADQALKVSFDPVRFEPGSSDLDAAARRYLAELAGKLVDKPKLALRVCGVAVDAERKRDKKGEYLDKEAEVLALAQQRADAVRAYLADKGAAGRQLRACRPGLDGLQTAQPRVDIRF